LFFRNQQIEKIKTDESVFQTNQSSEIIIEKSTMTQTKSLVKPPLKKRKSDQSSLLQHFKRSTQPKMTPSPNESTPKVCFILYEIY
jgi:hypothetical protein